MSATDNTSLPAPEQIMLEYEMLKLRKIETSYGTMGLATLTNRVYKVSSLMELLNHRVNRAHTFVTMVPPTAHKPYVDEKDICAVVNAFKIIETPSSITIFAKFKSVGPMAEALKELVNGKEKMDLKAELEIKPDGHFVYPSLNLEGTVYICGGGMRLWLVPRPLPEEEKIWEIVQLPKT